MHMYLHTPCTWYLSCILFFPLHSSLSCHLHSSLIFTRTSGLSIAPLSASDRKEVMSISHRWFLEDFDVVAFAYTPVHNHVRSLSFILHPYIVIILYENTPCNFSICWVSDLCVFEDNIDNNDYNSSDNCYRWYNYHYNFQLQNKDNSKINFDCHLLPVSSSSYSLFQFFSFYATAHTFVPHSWSLWSYRRTTTVSLKPNTLNHMRITHTTLTTHMCHTHNTHTAPTTHTTHRMENKTEEEAENILQLPLLYLLHTLIDHAHAPSLKRHVNVHPFIVRTYLWNIYPRNQTFTFHSPLYGLHHRFQIRPVKEKE